jgi:hypothetical protein
MSLSNAPGLRGVQCVQFCMVSRPLVHPGSYSSTLLNSTASLGYPTAAGIEPALYTRLLTDARATVSMPDTGFEPAQRLSRLSRAVYVGKLR